MTGKKFGREFSFLVQCCGWNFAGADTNSRPEAPTALDWDMFVNRARFHRVQGLVWNALAPHADRLPEDAKEMLSSDARAIAATNLAMAAECEELQGLFGRSRIPLLFLKGLTVAALAYRSPLLKMGWDIDLLIDPDDLEAAAQLLLERGYALRLPSQPAQLRLWHGQSKESVWSRDDSFHVELHTSLADNPHLIPAVHIHSPRQTVEVAPAVALPTLAQDELFAYLAVHGASSAWFRLKWIADFAALLAGRGEVEITRLYHRSQQLDAGRAAGQALLLADALFEVLEPGSALRDRLESDWSTRVLCRAALRLMADGDRDPTEKPFGTFAIHWTQLLLAPGLDYGMSELRRQGGLLRRHLQSPAGHRRAD